MHTPLRAHALRDPGVANLGIGGASSEVLQVERLFAALQVKVARGLVSTSGQRRLAVLLPLLPPHWNRAVLARLLRTGGLSSKRVAPRP